MFRLAVGPGGSIASQIYAGKLLTRSTMIRVVVVGRVLIPHTAQEKGWGLDPNLFY
jgi:hypothetical protein